MRRLLGVAAAAAFTLSACGGDSAGLTAMPAPAAMTSAARLVTLVLQIAVPPSAGHGRRHGLHPRYVSPSSKSIAIDVTRINGGPPPAGLATQTVTNLADCSNGCTVRGPSVPAGSATLALAIYDKAQTVHACPCAGKVLSQLSQTFTISAGMANSLRATLQGVPASFDFGNTLGSGTGGTAIVSRTLTVNVYDADGNAIAGEYANPVTVSDRESSNDALAATNVKVNGGAAASSVTLKASTDTVKFNYSGLAIAPVPFSASASGATTFHQTFATSNAGPSSQCGGDPTVCATVPTNPTVNLYATSGTGSTATLTASQTGWTNAGYLKDVTETDDCGAYATIALATATAANGGNGSIYTATALNSAAAAGSCTVRFKGGDATDHSEAITLTFTTSSVGIY